MKESAIEFLLFIPTGEYHAMGLRPYEANVTGSTINTLEAATDGFTNLQLGNLAGIAGRILRPSAAAAGTAQIDNGWGQQRYMFLMKVVHHNRYGSLEFTSSDAPDVQVQYVKGYTDFAGDPSFSGRVDPRMKLYMETVINTREVVRNNYRGSRMVSANRFLPQNAGSGRLASATAYALRPRDVVAAAGNRMLTDFVDSDFRTSLSCRPLLSTVRNELPSDYLYRTMGAFSHGINTNRYMAEHDYPSLMSEIASQTGDEPGIEDPFVLQLSQATELAEGSFFSYHELCRLYRGTEEATKIVPRTTVTREIGFGQHNPRDTRDWSASDVETVAATIVATAVPSLMVDAMLTQVAFFVTNDTVNGQTRFDWLSEPASFLLGTADLSAQATYFENHFLRETFKDLTHNGMMSVTLSFFSDLVTSDTRMVISLDGGDEMEYAVPNFAGSLISPVIGNDQGQLDRLAGSMGDLFDEMSPSALTKPSVDEFDRDDAFRLAGAGDLGSALRERNQPAGPSPLGGTGAPRSSSPLGGSDRSSASPLGGSDRGQPQKKSWTL